MENSKPSCLSTSPDIDRGWAGVIMICGCLVQVFTAGLACTTAIFYITFLDVFNESPSYTAWAVNINIFVQCVSGELANAVINLTSLRVTMVIGCVISTVGLIACSFASSLLWILILFGILTGIGHALCFFTMLIITSQYFVKYRVIAYGIGGAGVGLGQFIYAPLLRVLIDGYTWRGALLILAAINMNLLVIAAAIMPPRQQETRSAEKQHLMSDDNHGDRKETVCERLRKQLHHLHLFRRPRWLMFCFGCLFQNSGIFGFFVHVAKFADVLGFNEMQTASIASAVGVGGIIGRILFGLIAHHPRVHVVGLYVILMTIAGFMSVITAFMTNYIGLLLCSVVTGICVGSYAGIAEVTIHIVGVELLAPGLGYSIAFVAVGLLFGGPVGAWIYEADPTYQWSFVTFGLISTVGNCLMLPLWLQCSEGKVKQRRAADDVKLMKIKINESLIPSGEREIGCSN